MTYIIIYRYILPLALLITVACMLVSDIHFRAKERRNGINTKEFTFWYICRALRLVSLLAMATMFYKLGSQAASVYSEASKEATIFEMLPITEQWNTIFILAIVFVVTFMLDFIGRLKMLQVTSSKRAEDFFIQQNLNPEEAEILNKIKQNGENH
ncbi:MAG: hypothetical protein K6A35_03980 [bacterium]|nr:hypothetical protein [bacterium]